MIKKIFTIILALLALAGTAQIIPSGRTADWHLSGITDSINYDHNQIKLSNLNTAGNTDVSADIQQALDQMAASGGTVLLPEGFFVLNQSLKIPSGVRLKGSGSDSTVLIPDLPQQQNAININGTSSQKNVAINDWFSKGSDSLLLETGHNISVDDFVEITQDNGAWDTKPANWGSLATGTISRVVSVSGNKIRLLTPLSMALDSGLNPRIIPFSPLRDAAVECLSIRWEKNNDAGSSHAIHMDYAWNCRITGVESEKSPGAHIRISRSAHNNIFGNYIHHSYKYNGSGTRGYGLMLTHHASYNRIENNIFEHLRHAMMTKAGANTNVLAYNYSASVYREEYPYDAASDISLHGHYSYANLFEGNIVQNIAIDHYWGPSGPHNTFFRNRAEHYGIVITQGSPLTTSSQNFVGNEVNMNAGFLGQYIITGSDHFEYGNNIKGINLPSNTTTLNDSSLYLPAEPPYWDFTIPWPPIGYPNALEANENPAKSRYDSGQNITLCRCDTISAPKTTGFLNPSKEEFKIYPNPAVHTITIDCDAPGATASIISANGKTVSQTRLYQNTTINISELKPGLYILILETPEKILRSRFVKQ